MALLCDIFRNVTVSVASSQRMRTNLWQENNTFKDQACAVNGVVHKDITQRSLLSIRTRMFNELNDNKATRMKCFKEQTGFYLNNWKACEGGNYLCYRSSIVNVNMHTIWRPLNTILRSASILTFTRISTIKTFLLWEKQTIQAWFEISDNNFRQRNALDVGADY